MAVVEMGPTKAEATRVGGLPLTVLALAVLHTESSGQNLVLSQWVQLGRPNRCPVQKKKKKWWLGGPFQLRALTCSRALYLAIFMRFKSVTLVELSN